eukprot:CAMPEP_0181339288 /NCGR_PEP_ID=MMETSP1101-20121128/29165_1 /TAXON_ID=46948 /ORGANISM="Rhodomonas abbreviata, Strain Caron Lab Isolate" /LENGTH=167 /DNA_ID=CAMNT_0023450225 /DNA_START=6 /DNA_END=505 /DNA_ORIENTATION=-
MKSMASKNLVLQKRARELRSAHSRAMRLEEEVAFLQQQLSQTLSSSPRDKNALAAENEELRAQLDDAEEATSAALQELVETQLLYAEVLSGRKVESDPVPVSSDGVHRCERAPAQPTDGDEDDHYPATVRVSGQFSDDSEEDLSDQSNSQAASSTHCEEGWGHNQAG